MKGIVLLQGDSISKEDLNEANRLFNFFAFLMDSLYGTQSCTNNVHSLVHYAKCVEDNGPAWAVMSGFDFENFNGDFKNLFHGTQGVEKQVQFSFIGNKCLALSLRFCRKNSLATIVFVLFLWQLLP